MDPLTILALIKGVEGVVVDIIPLLIHRNSDGKVEKISIIALLEDTDKRNNETLRLIAVANSQPKV